ncbi:hypothetical protein BOTBODRAFT_181398 [Botryobasidium botryosum FD-172 SS1]|uniref:VPS10 domain-containing protein n=1 Tax=Botryobasidium botryosum (strain FD-172 SS1) TaxID=930990 RepID=A0A067LWF7_BOTB1|nr:hypothetical protein BOTBODRAFT_181398 [Botryobasidium botryosum FD-172 SS1]
MTRRALPPWLLFFLAAALAFLSCASAQKPEVKITKFHNLPARIFYFDDTEVVLYHDPVESDVYISDDEGKSWKRVPDVPSGEATMIIDHPVNNRYAFIITAGKKHYRTIDRGKTWQAFEMPVPPASVAQPLTFHADTNKQGHILYQGRKCESRGPWHWDDCHEETYYTEDAFGDDPQLLLSHTTSCQYARSTKEFPKSVSENLIYCVAYDKTAADGRQPLSASRLYQSEDYFKSSKLVEFGIGKKLARGVIALGVIKKYLVAALKDTTQGGSGEMSLYVSLDATNWSKARFPHASSSKLHENAYTVVESSTHSLAIDVLLHSVSSVGTLFVSNSDGTHFVEALRDTNRNHAGNVDYEGLYGIEGVGIANVVSNAQDVDGRGAAKKVKSVITFDGGSNWTPLRAPSIDVDGKRIKCDSTDRKECSLHLYSVTTPHNFGRIFSSPAPGFVMGVGSIGSHLLPYDDCDTFLSTDAGLTWKMVHRDAHKYEFGALGSVLVIVGDEEGTDHVRYSYDDGASWSKLDLGIKVRARLLTTIPDSTSQRFILLGSLSRKDQDNDGRHAVIFLDFGGLGKRVCGERDLEQWYARAAPDKECLMGHKQWYMRRKPKADCYIGEKFKDPVEHEDNCLCTDEDFECDFNFVRQGDECVPTGPEHIPAGVCTGERGQKYKGSSGYRLIPGNTCKKGPGASNKDEKVDKDCSQAQPAEGQVSHATFAFPALVVQNMYFKESQTVLVHLRDGSVWQSSNEGYTWRQPHPKERFLGIYMHSHSHDRAYLITDSLKLYVTTTQGRNWIELWAPMLPNSLGIQTLQFHPLQSDWLIWTGSTGCTGPSSSLDPCRTEAFYTRDHGRAWHSIESYVKTCSWARDTDLKIDQTQIICESYKDKKGSQALFGPGNPLELISGTDFYRVKKKLFDNVVGYTKFSEYLLVAEVTAQGSSLDLQVSLDGKNFAMGQFPPKLGLNNHAYTVLESNTDAVFLHVTMSQTHGAEWGSLLKSNSNGTFYGVSLDYANRDSRGYVDFEKMIGLDGIAVVNTVANPDEAALTGKKSLRTVITHNDGGTWKPLAPPSHDSLNEKYECSGAKCSLHLHGYTERFDPRATFSSPSAVGIMIAVGNVGEELKEYTESDTFLTRDGGFTWEEVHKDAHLFEFGDSGSVLVMANDEQPTDHVLYSTDEGLNWKEYQFGEAIRVRSILTVPTDTSRKFILLGYNPRESGKSTAVHLDFSALTTKQCRLDPDNPAQDDFELWSPSEEREERCLFGRQVLYHRRLRDRNCYVGNQPKISKRIVKNCECMESDFECEFNYARNANGECELVPGASMLPDNTTCGVDDEFWYERTAYRKIPHSSCEGGMRPDRGESHRCPGLKGHSSLFWWSIILLPFGFTALVGYWYYRRGNFNRGSIRLPDNSRSFDDSGPLSTLASIPWFILGVAGVAWGAVSSWPIWNSVSQRFATRSGYRTVPVDEDAQVLRFEDED